MSFRSAKLELISYVPELNAVQAGVRLNRAYQHALAAHPWSFLRKEAIINTVSPYSTGKATVVSGSTTVTGVGTAWTAAMAGMFLRFDQQMELYTVASVNPVLQTLTLDQAFPSTGLTNYAYQLFQFRYAKPTDCKDIISIRRSLNMPEQTVQYINTLDPDRESTGEPLWWANYNDTTLEVWPVPDTVYVLRMYYMRNINDAATEADVFLLPERLVIAGALMQSYQQLASDVERGQQYMQLFQTAAVQYKELWQYAVEDDMRKLSLPRDVQVDGWDLPVDNKFMYSHDVGDPRGPWS